ncbi:MAG: rhomboid family intramembrane serine protease [Abitibacteriaceae bacterium]|nr:rhomboid family intramembrane serine protease [Abditibacteriaceae bacterium]
MLTGLMPLGDENEDRLSTPYVTYFLIAINIGVFIFLQGAGANDQFTYGYSVIPYEIISGRDIVTPIQTGFGSHNVIPEAPGPMPIYLTILTAMFMHGSWMHLLGNMLYMWIFGDNVEDALGHAKFLAFYLLCGLGATFAHIGATLMFHQDTLMPSLGASGAIAGVLGGYIVMYPTRRVRVLLGYFLVDLPAFIVIGFWIITQIVSGVGSIARTEQTSGGGVAYFAHIGGVLTGVLLISLFRNPDVHARVRQRMDLPASQPPYGNPY